MARDKVLSRELPSVVVGRPSPVALGYGNKWIHLTSIHHCADTY